MLHNLISINLGNNIKLSVNSKIEVICIKCTNVIFVWM